MRDVLAERLLAEVMQWSAEDVATERPRLEALAAFKYDEYQQFVPGMKFIESLALWLAQFEELEERRAMYGFIKNRLVFVSAAEMSHFVSIAYPDYICPRLINESTKLLHLPEWAVAKVRGSVEFRILLRRSLFLGLSDGAHIDLFRRNNLEISHEQILQTYEITADKAVELSLELTKDLRAIGGNSFEAEGSKFSAIFLLDDFSGSGLSYLRTDKVTGKPAGKIHKVFSKLVGNDSLSSILDLAQLRIFIVLYVATERAVRHLRSSTLEWLSSNGLKNCCDVLSVQTIPNFSTDDNCEQNIIPLLQKYFDKSVVDDHYSKGDTKRAHMGFDGCALSLVLHHNTPNNSFPVLWFEEGMRRYRGLFPRVSRHRN